MTIKTTKVMETKKSSLCNSTKIDIRDEKEFKLWVRFIASVYKNGGDINKPSEILWRSVVDEINPISQKRKKIRVGL